MRQSFRWFGPKDPISLSEFRQAGVTDVVTALHHVPCGQLWTTEEISRRAREVSEAGMAWTVAESLPIHEDIKRRTGDFRGKIHDYMAGLENLAASGVKVICYNFMPVLDWTRTELNLLLPDGTRTMFYDMIDQAAFDLFILKRPGAAADYPAATVKAAEARFASMDDAKRAKLSDSILMGLPGTVDDLTIEEFRAMIATYKGIDDAVLRKNLYAFLNEIMPLCEYLGVRMAIHPDDPPRPIFGLPRIMSRESDIDRMVAEVQSRNCGIAFCTGSFGGRKENDPVGMFERHVDRVFFAHFRNLHYLDGRDDAFYESGQLTGDFDMARLMTSLVKEEERRKAAGDPNWQIYVRPDHGRLFECDVKRGSYAGYSYVGRVMGLAELRGLEVGIRSAMGLDYPGKRT
jgi:mannonate dehydratase